MDLLRVPTCLSFPLLGGSKLGAHISMQPGLLFHLLLTEELGLLPATSNEGLKRRSVSKIQKYMKKGESEREDQADIRPVETMMSRRTPLAWLKASIIAENPTSRLSRSMLSVASSSEKRVNVGSQGSIHWSSGSPRTGERLPPDIRAKSDLPLVLSTTAKAPEDPLAVSPTV